MTRKENVTRRKKIVKLKKSKESRKSMLLSRQLRKFVSRRKMIAEKCENKNTSSAWNTKRRDLLKLSVSVKNVTRLSTTRKKRSTKGS
jgi:hypothetical protein